jgi:hypothetical protein
VSSRSMFKVEIQWGRSISSAGVWSQVFLGRQEGTICKFEEQKERKSWRKTVAKSVELHGFSSSTIGQRIRRWVLKQIDSGGGASISLMISVKRQTPGVKVVRLFIRAPNKPRTPGTDWLIRNKCQLSEKKRSIITRSYTK